MTNQPLDRARTGERAGTPVRDTGPCDLYAPGHQMHCTHQGRAMRTPATPVGNVVVDGALVTLVLEDGSEPAWRQVVYLEHHALRVGPYWFNCAVGSDVWQDCGRGESP